MNLKALQKVLGKVPGQSKNIMGGLGDMATGIPRFGKELMAAGKADRAAGMGIKDLLKKGGGAVGEYGGALGDYGKRMIKKNPYGAGALGAGGLAVGGAGAYGINELLEELGLLEDEED
jgi:hypothetical protein